MKVKLGKLVATPGAIEEVNQVEMRKAIIRHQNGDWGNVCEEDKQANDEAAEQEDRILSSYKTENGTKFWIITEADRSVTTILLPEEY